MVKKILCCLLLATFLITISGCLKTKNFITTDNANENSSINSETSQENTTQSDKNTTSSKPTQSTPNKNNQSGNSSVGAVVEKPIEKDENTSVSSPTIDAPLNPTTPHTPLSREDYFQYYTLDTKQKEIYNKICTAIQTTQNVVNLKRYRLDFETVWQIYQKVIADNPQYFWVSKFITYTEISENGKSLFVDLYISYTDGEITDTFDNKANLSVMADRKKIQTQIEELNNLTENILSNIPSTAPDIEKEKLIHDAVLSTVSYDYSGINISPSRENYPRIWDIYGALSHSQAVCEGYAKLFQYLCYQVGINANYVCGTSEGQGHAWNVVKLNGNWYFVDVTWDDASTDNPPMPIYTYFNITTDEILKDHEIDNSVLSVPTADSNEFAFTKTFGVNILSLDTAPENFETAIDYAIKFNEKYLICNLNGLNADFEYINKYFLNPKSEIQIYLKSKGKTIKLQPLITLGGYVYLKFN